MVDGIRARNEQPTAFSDRGRIQPHQRPARLWSSPGVSPASNYSPVCPGDQDIDKIYTVIARTLSWMIRPVNAPMLNRNTQDWSGSNQGFTFTWMYTDLHLHGCKGLQRIIRPMFAARFGAPYNQSFTNKDGKPATINCEIML
jgi:hypothetical protein